MYWAVPTVKKVPEKFLYRVHKSSPIISEMLLFALP
jgi:hypothetical protein